MSANRDTSSRAAAEMTRFLKSLLERLLFGCANFDISTRIRNGNSSFIEHARSINSITAERRLNGFLESNREEIGINEWSALSHIHGGG